ncbi:DNA repair protein RadA [Candidatus Atribacteria bacterium MT.SAG.1]|nr:DNA repair protein RadA [Candidatus Atribacteria bacterium MT.SAG.1]
MGKEGKTIFRCQQCGYESFRWLGRCPDCGGWNTLIEEVFREEKKYSFHPEGHSVPLPISKIEIGKNKARYKTEISELDRVLGGGIVPGSLILVGGEPGIGKSTLLLQMANSLSSNYGIILYVSAEESLYQIKLRASRLGVFAEKLFLVSETDIEVIKKHINEIKPKVVIVDSIQAINDYEISSSPGSISQVRECTAQLMRLAKSKEISIFIIGHVTKGGILAGPKVLEHIVDTVLYLEGEQYNIYRILRSTKNRFGSTNELGIFKMEEKGLAGVLNPSELLLSEKPSHVSGSVVAAAFEGSRPLLVEMQALVSYSNLGIPRRMTTGVDYNRVLLILAVLEKRVGYSLHSQDVHVNIAGGIKVLEPSLDLAIIMAVASSFKDVPIDSGTVIFGEVGLAGEVRMVNQVEKRIQEVLKMGFKRCIIPKSNLKNLNNFLSKKDLTIIGVKTVQEAINLALN